MIQQLNRWIIGLSLLILGLVATGCNAIGAGDKESLYIPPTPAAAGAVATPAATQPAPTPTSTLAASPTPPCSDNLRYIEDLTIPDGSAVSPGQQLDKQWSVENNGTCNWDESYRLILIGGPDLGAAPEQALYPARSGTQLTIRMLFTAPNEAGAYRSAWQAVAPDGRAFGDPIFIEVQVEG